MILWEKSSSNSDNNSRCFRSVKKEETKVEMPNLACICYTKIMMIRTLGSNNLSKNSNNSNRSHCYSAESYWALSSGGIVVRKDFFVSQFFHLPFRLLDDYLFTNEKEASNTCSNRFICSFDRLQLRSTSSSLYVTVIWELFWSTQLIETNEMKWNDTT